MGYMGWKACCVVFRGGSPFRRREGLPALWGALRAGRQGNLQVSVLQCRGISQKARAFVRSFRRDRWVVVV
jgi:hypothetical protein